MQKHFFATIVVLLCTTTLVAQPRSQEEMEQIALQKLGTQTRRAAGEGLKLLTQEEMYSVWGNSGQGFVIVSNDQQLPPVLAYSTNTMFNAKNIPCGMKWWLQTISSSLKNKMQQGLLVSTIHRASKVKIEPMLTTQWDQNGVFNAQCPILMDNKKEVHAPTGCVATALAQVLYFHKYPGSSEGTGSYTKDESDIVYYADIKTTYDWTLFKDSYKNSYFIEQESKDAVAQLMFDCGLAVQMRYNLSGSSSTIGAAAKALGDHFKCDSLAAKVCDRELYDNDEWIDIVREELEAGRPVLYGGSDAKSGGHAFVIHGIDENDLVYVNWGWGGTGDCWCDISSLSPLESNNVYTNKQVMAIGLKKQPTPNSEEKYQSLWRLEDKVKISQTFKPSKSFTIATFTAFNYYHLTFYGTIGICVDKTDGSEKLFVPILSTGEEPGPFPYGYGMPFSQKVVSATDLSSLSAGSYHVYLASKAFQEDTPQAMKYAGGWTDIYTISIADDRNVNIDENVQAVKDVTTGVQYISIETTANAPARYFDLQGREVSNDVRGLVIMKQGNVVKKVIR